MDEEVWKHAVFSENRERLLNEQIAQAFFQRVLRQAQPYLSDEHFTVDGTLIEAGLARSVSGARTREKGLRARLAKRIFMASSGAIKRINPPPTPTPG